VESKLRPMSYQRRSRGTNHRRHR